MFPGLKNGAFWKDIKLYLKSNVGGEIHYFVLGCSPVINQNKKNKPTVIYLKLPLLSFMKLSPLIFLTSLQDLVKN